MIEPRSACGKWICCGDGFVFGLRFWDKQDKKYFIPSGIEWGVLADLVQSGKWNDYDMADSNLITYRCECHAKPGSHLPVYQRTHQSGQVILPTEQQRRIDQNGGKYNYSDTLYILWRGLIGGGKKA